MSQSIIVRRGLARALMVLAALAVGVAAVALPARPAQAYPSERICFVTYGGWLICPEVPITIERPPLQPRCPTCAAIELDFGAKILPEQRIRVNELVAAGFGLLVEADLAEEPGLVDQFRGAAMQRFAAAAVELGDHPIAVGATGAVNLDSGVFEPLKTDNGWLESAAADTVAGLKLLSQGALDPDPDPVSPAARLFDNAYETLRDRG